jgi:hypothetical protein
MSQEAVQSLFDEISGKEFTHVEIMQLLQLIDARTEQVAYSERSLRPETGRLRLKLLEMNAVGEEKMRLTFALPKEAIATSGATQALQITPYVICSHQNLPNELITDESQVSMVEVNQDETQQIYVIELDRKFFEESKGKDGSLNYFLYVDVVPQGENALEGNTNFWNLGFGKNLVGEPGKKDQVLYQLGEITKKTQSPDKYQAALAEVMAAHAENLNRLLDELESAPHEEFEAREKVISNLIQGLEKDLPVAKNKALDLIGIGLPVKAQMAAIIAAEKAVARAKAITRP